MGGPSATTIGELVVAIAEDHAKSIELATLGGQDARADLRARRIAFRSGCFERRRQQGADCRPSHN